MRRFRQILEGTNLGQRLEVITAAGEKSWLRELGKNDIQHSRAVEQVLDRLVPDGIKEDQGVFDLGEIFLLLVSVYLHDVGRKTAPNSHELESYRVIRQDPRRFHLDGFEAEAVAQICAAHAAERVWPIKQCDANYGIAGLTASGRTFNLQRLGALLRVADELENTYLRVLGIPDQADSPRNIIRDINPVPEMGVIEIHAQPKTWRDWAALMSVRDHSERRLREVRKYLGQLGLSYYQVWLRPDEFTAPLITPQPLDSYHDLVERVAMLMEPRFDSVDMLSKVGDCEISIVCSSSPLGLETKTAILVAPSLDAGLALEYVGALGTLVERGLFHHGLIVSGDENISVECQKLLSGTQVSCVTFRELLPRLYGFSASMKRYARDYENGAIFKKGLFIEPSGTLESGEEIGRVEEYVLKWLNTPSCVHLTILGDYGSGKTTLAQRLAYDLAKVHEAGSSNSRIPLLIDLKDLRFATSIEAAITDILVNKLRQDIDYRSFDTLNKAGRFLIILDGFDEVAGLVDESTALEAFRQFDHLVNENAKIILTCRTHFFKDVSQVHRIHEGSALYHAIDAKYGYKLLFLSLFTEDQIRDYLHHWDPKHGQDYFDLVDGTYNLKDLAKRPVLLNMIARTVPQLDSSELASGGVLGIDVAVLYELYIRFWLERDDWRSPLNVEERRTVAEAIAEYLFTTGKQTVHFHELPPLLPDWYYASHSGYGLEVLDIECRTCNFLTSDRQGNYGFAHRSFQEYLLASIFAQSLLDRQDTDIHLKWHLPLEQAPFPDQQSIRAPVEVEAFVVQIVRRRLSEMTPDEVYTRINRRPRAEAVLVRLLEKLTINSYALLLANLIKRPRRSVTVPELAKMLLKSPDLESALRFLIGLVDANSDLDHFLNVYDELLRFARRDQAPLIGRLNDRISEFEPFKDEQDLATLGVDAGYPFTRVRQRSQLDAALKGINDPDELQEVRKRFRREWKRDKAAYDTRLKRQASHEHELEKRLEHSRGRRMK